MDLNRALYHSLKLAAVTNLLIGTLFLLLFWTVAPQTMLFAWYVVLFLLSLSRLWLSFRFHQQYPDESLSLAPKWAHWYLAGVISSGAMWALATVLFFPAGNPVYQAYLAIIVAGLVAGSATTMGFALRPYLWYVSTMTLPLIIRLVYQGETDSTILASMMLVFVYIVSALALRFSRHYQLSTKLTAQTHQQERELLATAERFKLLFEHIPDAVLLHDFHGRILDANTAACRTLSYSFDELKTRTMQELDHSGLPGGLEAVWAALQPHEIKRVEGIQQRKDGSQFPVEMTLSLFNDMGMACVLVSVRDISQRLQYEKQIIENEALIQSQYQSVPIPSMTWRCRESNCELINLNEAAIQHFGAQMAEQVGKTVTQVYHSDSPVPALLSQCYQQQSDINTRLTLYHERFAQERIYSVKVIFVVPDLLIIYMDDITEEEKHHQEILRTREEAIKANLAKTDFLSRMSHELRTPLHAIIGYAQLIGMEKKADEQSRENAQEIRTAGEHLLSLINDILDISRLESSLESSQAAYNGSRFNPVALINEVIQLMQPAAAAAGVGLKLKTESAELLIETDKLKLKQILLNLVSNAIKYNHRGGEVDIFCQVEEQEFCLRVCDTGAGIASEHMENLFEPFNRLGAEYSEVEGTGIGLTITQKLVQFLHGRIRVESEPGKGSCFEVVLPTSEGTPGMTESDTPTVLTTGNRKVLYIEDNPVNMRLVDKMLAKVDGLSLLQAETPERGLELAQQGADLILLDLHLPNISGFEVLQRLQAAQATRDIPVIVLSASHLEEDVQKARALGAIDYMTKPVNLKSLRSTIIRVTKAGIE